MGIPTPIDPAAALVRATCGSIILVQECHPRCYSSFVVPQLKQTPTVDGFDEVLELLVRELLDDNGQPRESWIRGSLTAVGTKLRTLNFILKRSSAGPSPTLLDIGAQIGSLVIYAQSLGIKPAAVDLPSFTEMFARASRKCGIEYKPCDVTTDSLPFPGQSFDYVTYLDVIEHHPHSPKRVLQEIHRVLMPGGCVIITTPNQASIYNRLQLLAGRSISDPFDYFFQQTSQMTPYPGHHREYVRSELRSALASSGFHVLECRVIEEDFQPELRLALRSQNGSVAGKIWRHKRTLGATALGAVWSALALPFGRVLWAVGEKQERLGDSK